VYRVVLAGDAVDLAATARLRGGARTTPMFDFGEAREAWERVHGVAAECIAAWLPSLPLGVRRHAQAQAYLRLHAGGAGPYDSAEVAAVLDRLGAELTGARL
jgi:hypothetical protein